MDSVAGSIVVGVDDSEASRRALHWAGEQALAERRQLVLAHAVDLVTPAYTDVAAINPQEAREALRAEGEKVLENARADLVKRHPELEVHVRFRLGDPRELLLDLSGDAHLLVVGSRGRGALRHLLLGSVSVALVRHAECPVVVHRPGRPGQEHHGIVVGADASEEARTVLEFAYREASLRALPLTVLHCFWDVRASYGDTRLVRDKSSDLEAERLQLAEVMAGMAEKYPEVAVRGELARRLPQEALVNLGDRMDLIVVGTHHTGRLSQMLFGSVPLSVVEHANCPVAVVPLGRHGR